MPVPKGNYISIWICSCRLHSKYIGAKICVHFYMRVGRKHIEAAAFFSKLGPFSISLGQCTAVRWGEIYLGLVVHTELLGDDSSSLLVQPLGTLDQMSDCNFWKRTLYRWRLSLNYYQPAALRSSISSCPLLSISQHLLTWPTGSDSHLEMSWTAPTLHLQPPPT